MYSKKEININKNFSINTINLIGDKKVNQILKNKLKKKINEEKNSTKLNLNLNSRIEKSVTSKNKKGNPIGFSIKITTNLEVFENKILKGKKNFEGKFKYNNISNKFDLKQYEKYIKDNLISKLSYEIIKYLNSLK
tara:strand:+ start:128 stop:535 length:408 start_codon:yes stop_codon:yes gene_type:complete